MTQGPKPVPTPDLDLASKRSPVLGGLLGGALATVGSLSQYPLLYHVMNARWFTALAVGASIGVLALVARLLSGTPRTPRVLLVGALLAMAGSFVLPSLFGWMIVSGCAGLLGGAVSRETRRPMLSLLVGLGVTFVGAVLHAPITAFVPALVMLTAFGVGANPRTLVH